MASKHIYQTCNAVDHLDVIIVLVGFHDGDILENPCSPSLQDNQKLRDEMAAMKDTLDSLAKQTTNSSAPTLRPNPKVKAKGPSALSEPARACAPNDVDGSQPDADSANDSSGDGGGGGLSEAAKRQRLRRLCERKGKGKLNVPVHIHEMWAAGGHSRDQLCELLEQSGYDKDRY